VISSTYRIQLRPGFGFDDARAIVPRLDALGISHVYASPYWAARPGSDHGYDLVDPRRLNPELGTEDAFRAFGAALGAHDMGHIVDFVPNHMAASPLNLWWHDVLENGRASIYTDTFDIEWSPPKEALRDKVLLPVLGAQYGEVLEKGELAVHREGGAFVIRYAEHAFPVDPASIAPLLTRAAETLDLPAEDPSRQELESITSGLGRLEPSERAREKEVLRRRLAALAEDPRLAGAIDAEVARTNADIDALDALIVAQRYRLAYWRVATEEINYRRFFDINELAAIRMEAEPVFATMHEKLLSLIAEGLLDGVRLDHVDGLYDPEGYFEKLRSAIANLTTRPIWILAEKILSPSEALPATWAIDGTTGYEWLAAVNGLFVDPSAEERITASYVAMTGDTHSFAEHVRDAKRAILRTSLASELQMLALRLERLAMRDRRSRDFTLATLRRALGETIAAFPVYRTYVRPDGRSTPTDVKIVTRAIRVARKRNPEISPSVFAFLREHLLGKGDEPDRVELAMRFQQLTGPVMAKGVEDTTFYRYVRFVALNEVGGAPDRFGTPVADFHRRNAEHRAHHPRTMTTTTTHDTKRSEDVRARLAVLSEMPEEYTSWIREWTELARPFVHVLPDDEGDDAPPSSVVVPPRPDTMPSAGDQLLFFQTLLGAYGGPDLVDRIEAYMIKAAREAKQHTSWLNPDEVYETHLRAFCRGMLGLPAFDVAKKVARIAPYGASNSLAQVVLKIASPGIPDTYQGSETWDFRLVDPDNRRPVDHSALAEALRSVEGRSVRDLRDSFEDGGIKLHVLSRGLRARRAMPALFVEGDYVAIDAGETIVAFARNLGASSAVCAVTRFPKRVAGARTWACGDVWGERTITLPPGGVFRDVLCDRTFAAGEVRVAQLFLDLPVALLIRSA
jgi:(1->4)-alpha-D-glucan 1-alpha-D-glucosylmutase